MPAGQNRFDVVNFTSKYISYEVCLNEMATYLDWSLTDAEIQRYIVIDLHGQRASEINISLFLQF